MAISPGEIALLQAGAFTLLAAPAAGAAIGFFINAWRGPELGAFLGALPIAAFLVWLAIKNADKAWDWSFYAIWAGLAAYVVGCALTAKMIQRKFR